MLQVYIYYTIESIMEHLGCGHGKDEKLLAELERHLGEMTVRSEWRDEFSFGQVKDSGETPLSWQA